MKAAGATLRIDRFFWFARLAPSRTSAQDLLLRGHVRLDGRPVERAATPVRTGQIVTFPHGDRVRAIRIEALPVRRGPPAEARACYLDLIQGS